MASRKQNQQEFQLLLPSLALSLLVFVLVAVIMIIPKSTPQPTAQAGQKSYLSKSDEVDSLESDLILLEADNIEEELRVLNTLN